MSRLTLRPLTLLLVLFLCQRNLLLTVANDELNPVSSSISFYGGTYTVIRPPSQSLHASFHFSTAHGALLVADIEHITGYLALTLNNGTLEATLSGGDERLQSLLSLSVDSTHTLQRYLELSVSEDQVMLTLDGDSVRTNLSSRLNFSGWVNLAGPPSGNSSVYSSLISAGSYVGCMLNVTINSHSVELDGDIQVGYSSGCCIPPRRTPLRQSINYDQYPWNNISVQVSAVAVDEADNVTITDLNLGLLIPEDLINSETGYWLRSEVESRIVFDIVSEPQFGFFTRGLSNARISTFRFSDLLSDDSITRVVYHHSGHEGIADSAELRAYLECQDGEGGSLSHQFTLPFTITERNDDPYIVHQKRLSIAIGTRRVITPDIITVQDHETTNSSMILYLVEYIAASDVCDLCQDDPAGRIEKTDNPSSRRGLFSQDDINKGKIAFQHFTKYGNHSVTIGLRVQADTKGILLTHIEVRPRVGTISLTTDPGVCLFLEEGHTSTIETSNLNTTTDFEDQDPMVSFDVIAAPKHGRLEIFDTKLLRWSLINETINSQMQDNMSLIGTFTQSDVNRGYVRYVHTPEKFGLIDKFLFQLRSTEFVSGNISSFCFHIVSEALLIKPDIVLAANTVQLKEGGRTVIDSSILSIALTPQDFLYGPHGGINIEIEDINPQFILQEEPHAGSIVLSGRTLKTSDSFLLEELRRGLVFYNHSGSEVHDDVFCVNAEATADKVELILIPDPSPVVEINVTVTPVNNRQPTYTSSERIQVTEGSIVYISSANILIKDEDIPNDVLSVYLRKPRPNKTNEIQTGYFAFSDNATKPILRLTMDHINDNRVIFVHTLNESAELTYFQTLKIDDGLHFITPKPQIMIEAVPHNLTVRIIPLPNSECSIYLDALIQPLIAPVNSSQFAFSMLDRFGENSNLVPFVDVMVSTPPRYGQLYKVTYKTDFTNASRVHVSKFTESDLKMRRIEYHFSNQSVITRQDSFDLDFRYGHSVVRNVSVKVCINPIPLPDVVLIQSAFVSQEGLSSINSTHLLANDTRGGGYDMLLYVIIEDPRYGHIVNPSGNPLRQFSQANLNSNEISYARFDSSTAATDSFSFKVCTQIKVCTEPKKLQLITHFVNLTVVNPGINVTEGRNYTFTFQDLSATAPPNYTDVRFFPIYTADNGPQHGALQLNHGFNIEMNPTRFDSKDIELGRLIYSNDGNEYLNDGFMLKVSAQSVKGGALLTVVEFVRINIIPVNDYIPEFLNLSEYLAVAKGGSLHISSADLSAHDYDSDIDDLDLIYQVLANSPLYGYLYLDTDPKSIELGITNWTERDIREGRLYYKQTVEAVEDLIILQLIDDPLHMSPPSQTKYLKVSILDVVFMNVANLTSSGHPFTVAEGGTRVISSEFLLYRAVNDESLVYSDIEYHVVNPPIRGFLTLNGTKLLKNGSFTQQHIVDGQFAYVHDHSNHLADKFNFTLTVPSRSSKPQKFTFPIMVKIVDDDPPLVEFITDPVLVVEKSVVTMDDEIIRIIDHDTTRFSVDTDKIKCQVISLKEPRNGVIQRRRVGGNWSVLSLEFTKYDIDQGNLRYNHTILGKYQDQFVFNVTDGVNHQNTTYTVNIVILPIRLVLNVQSITVDEGDSLYLEPDYFNVDHLYLSTVPGVFLITEPPRGGVLRNLETNETGISNFTTGLLTRRSIKYVHNGGEDDVDGFSFVYQSHDPVGFNRMSTTKTFEITVIGINDQAPVLDPNRKQRLKLWAGETKDLNEAYLNASDGDTLRRHLVYRLHPTEFDGYVAFKNDTGYPISTFTQEDVSRGRIVFVHKTDQEGKISYDVSDGEITVTGNLTVEADPLMLWCNVDPCTWNPVTVPRGGRVPLTFDNLCCITNDPENNRELLYHVMSIQYGIVLLNSTPVKIFTKHQVEMGLVYYEHTDMDRWETKENLSIQVTTDLDTSRNVDLLIQLDLPQSMRKPAINSGLRVEEGGVSCLNESLFDARNVRYFAWRDSGARNQLENLNIHFLLSKLPARGYLTINGEGITSVPPKFTHNDVLGGGVCYHHDDSESEIDTLQFVISIVGEDLSVHYTEKESLNISITPQNDIRPSLVTLSPGIQLVEGFTYTLTENDLEIDDGDSEPSEIIIFLDSLPDNADIRLKHRTLKVGSNFSQSHINMGHVTLAPHAQLSSGGGNFQFHFTDEDTANVNSTMYELSVSVVPHTLQVLGTKHLNYKQNELRAKITRQSLYSDTNGMKRETLFTVTERPTDGMIIAESGQALALTKFTQDDIDSERVWYIPNADSRRHSDSFLVNVTNRNLTIPNVAVEIHVLVWGDVKDDTRVDFSNVDGSDYLFRLPRDIIKLKMENRHPEISVLDPPKYGRLKIQIDDNHISKRAVFEDKYVQDSEEMIKGVHLDSRRAVNEADYQNGFSFHYDDLKNGWIFYLWDCERPLDSEPVIDNFTLLVSASSMRPGEAFVELEIIPPIPPTTTTPLTHQSTSPKQFTDEPIASVTQHPDSGFPVFTLIPIVGVISILVILIIVVIVFCLSQQKRIRKKLQPTMSQPSPQYPWSVSPPLSPTRPVVAQYQFDPNVPESDNGDLNSVSSGFSEEGEIPPVHSPTLSHAFSYSPPYTGQPSPSPTYSSHAPMPLSRRPQVCSNVSISFSGRHSAMSEVSLERLPQTYSHSLPRPPASFAVPVPVRPASHVAYIPSIATCESGYNSNFHTNENSRLPSHSNSLCASEREADQHFPFAHADEEAVEDSPQAACHASDQVHTTTISVVNGKSLEKDSELYRSDESGLHELLDLNDPNVQRLFKASHPVLGKQEYWF